MPQTLRHSFPDLIDLDDSDAYENLADKERLLVLHLTVCYILQRMFNSDLIALKVFIGLLPPLPAADQLFLPELALEIASIGLTCTDLSILMRTIMIMDEIKRIFSLKEQELILKELLLRKK